MGWIARCLLLLGITSASLAQQSVQIQFAEPVSLQAAPGRTQFDAYGRRFSLTLEANDRLLNSLSSAHKARLQFSSVLRGKVDGVAESWVRLTRVAGRIEGAIWDGRDLYVVGPYRQIAPYLSTPLAVSPDTTTVHRLSDTLNALPREFCAVGPRFASSPAASPVGATTALKQYQAIVDELRMAAAVVPSDQLQISLLADLDFQNRHGADSLDTMVARLNVVDGIFASQLGIILVPSEFRLMPVGGDPFTSSVSQTLLGQLSTYRENTPAVRSTGLAHLMTGKSLDGGGTLGIAFVDSLCDVREGASLSSSDEIAVGNAVVMAHEIGHNFGAGHDGVPGGACPNVEQNYIMAPLYGGSTIFSQCARDTIAEVVVRERGTCLVSPDYADVSLEAPVSSTADVGSPFTVPFTVRSVGSRAAANVTLDVMLGANLTFQGANIPGGNCSASAYGVHCTLGNLAVGESRVVELQLQGSQVTQYNLRAGVQADNDHLVDDNELSYQLNLRSAVDLAVTVSATPSTVFVGEPIDFTVDVSSMRSGVAQGARLDINLFSLTVDSFVAGPHACQIEGNALRCNLADIAAGATTRITLRGHSDVPRQDSVQANLLLTGDGDGSNDHRFVNVSVRAEREVNVSPGSQDLNVVVGSSFDVTYTLTTAGRLVAPDVRLRIDPMPFNYGVIESITPDTGTCDAPTNNSQVSCQFGDLNPGDVRTVVIRVRMEQIGTTYLNARSEFLIGGVLNFSSGITMIRADVGTDVVVTGHQAPVITEGQTSGGSVTMRSQGVNLAQNVVATLEVSAPLRLTQAGFTGPANFSCALDNPQRARCTGAFTGTTPVSLDFRYSGDIPADYQATFAVTAAGDAIADNNGANFQIRVRPYLDVAVTSSTTGRLDLIVGENRAVDVTVTTGVRPVPGVRLVASDLFSAYEVVSMNAPGYTCQEETFGMSCSLGDQPAGASVPVQINYRALTGNTSSTLTIGSVTANDSNPANDNVSFHWQSMTRTDLALSVAQTTVTATSGTTFNFPRVSVTSPGDFAHGVVVEIPMPAFASIQSVSTTAICSGTATLRCDFGLMTPGSTGAIDIVLTATRTGSFASDITLRATNDSTPNNNAGTVTTTVNAQSQGGGSSGGGGSSSSGGGGGGGGFEWLSLGVLALLAGRRGRTLEKKSCA